MPVVNADGCPIHVVVEGRDDAPVLMLSNSLGTTHRMWDDQVKPFTQHFRLVRYDRRGVVAIMDALGIKTMNWCGLSMGGMVGMWLGANVPDRINKLILSNTSAY